MSAIDKTFEHLRDGLRSAHESLNAERGDDELRAYEQLADEVLGEKRDSGLANLVFGGVVGNLVQGGASPEAIGRYAEMTARFIKRNGEAVAAQMAAAHEGSPDGA